MASVIVDDLKIKAVADAVRVKAGTDAKMSLDEMPDAILNLFLVPEYEFVGMVKDTVTFEDIGFQECLSKINTSANVIVRPAVNREYELIFNEAVDSEEYDIVCMNYIETNYIYNNDTILPRIISHGSLIQYKCLKVLRNCTYPIDDTGTEIVTVAMTRNSGTRIMYINNTGAIANVTSGTYSLNNACQVPTLSSSNNEEGSEINGSVNYRYYTRVHINTPAITARASTTQMSVASYEAIDADKSTIDRYIVAFKAKRENRDFYDKAIENLYLNAPVEDYINPYITERVEE